MRKLLNRLVGTECRHPETIVVSSVGVRRAVCQACGHISFEMMPGVTSNRRPAKTEELERVVGL